MSSRAIRSLIGMSLVGSALALGAQSTTTPPATDEVSTDAARMKSRAQVEYKDLIDKAERLRDWPSVEKIKTRDGRVVEALRASTTRIALDHVTRGTTGLVLHWTKQEPELTADQKALLAQALAETDAVRKETAGRELREADVERVRQAERRVVLAYWEEQAQGEKAADALAPHQMGYVFEQRFKELSQKLEAENGSAEVIYGLSQGAEQAAALSQMTDVPPTPGMDGLLESFDRLSRQALKQPANNEKVRWLQTFSADLGQQTALLAKGSPAVELTVRTIRTKGNGKEEALGYNVRYELEADEALGTPRGTSLGGTTTLKDRLGPYHYVFWAEDQGKEASSKKRVNLGDPLQASREIELPLTVQP